MGGRSHRTCSSLDPHHPDTLTHSQHVLLPVTSPAPLQSKSHIVFVESVCKDEDLITYTPTLQMILTQTRLEPECSNQLNLTLAF